MEVSKGGKKWLMIFSGRKPRKKKKNLQVTLMPSLAANQLEVTTLTLPFLLKVLRAENAQLGLRSKGRLRSALLLF